MATDNLTMKLLISGQSKKVLFAEAGKDVVDFLFGLLAMPLGSIIKLLKKEDMGWCMGSLYQSLEGLEDNYVHSNHNKVALLEPKVSATTLTCPLLLQAGPVEVKGVKKYYRCSGRCPHSHYVTDVRGTSCPSHNYQMTTELAYVGPKVGEVEVNVNDGGGCVKGVVTYTIMDDLTIAPMSAISCITLLTKLHVKDLCDLQEKTVTFGFNEALKMLKASLDSKTALTDTFLCEES